MPPKSKKTPKNARKNTHKLKNRALNAFNYAMDDDEYIKGTRQQQDIDLEDIADKRIKGLLDGTVTQEDDEELDSDELLGSESDYGMDNGQPDSDWGDSLDEDELVPLSAAWDMASDDEFGTKVAARDAEAENESAQWESEDQEGLDSSDGSDEELEELDSDAGSSASDVGSSDSELEYNPAALRKAIKSINSDSMNESAKLDRTAGPENPEALPSRNEKLSLSDLAASSNTELKLFAPKVKQKALEMPLPERIKNRGDRAAAYELTKDEVSKWEDTVKENRRADHLSFPINAPPQVEKANPFVPTLESNELEQKVDDLLKQSQVKDEAALSAFEQVAPTNLTFEEMKKRRVELRAMRELMFREEQRAKRIKKIKSKSYRRVHKKERMKQEAIMREAQDEEVDPEDLARARALERASLKHKTTSKWAKRMIDTGMSKDASTRAELESMLQQGEDLRQRIHGDADEHSDVSDFGNDEEPVQAPKGIMAMKFMQDADKRQRAENKRMLDESESEPELSGRRSYGPDRGNEELEAMERDAEEEAEADNEKSLSKRLKTKHTGKPKGGELVLKYNEEEETPQAAPDASNPWLALSSSKNRTTFTATGKDSTKNAKSIAKLAKAKGTSAEKADIDVGDTLDTMVRKNELSFEQQDLIRKAFAGDDVVAEFEAEKQQLVEDEGDKLVDETMPGWGSWGGEGLKPKVQRFRKVEGIDARKRKDHGKKGVIISERQNKKLNKYAASAVPFPYQNAAQYERSLQTPIGNEWATRDTFQRQTQPRVMVKKGEIIDPIKRK